MIKFRTSGWVAVLAVLVTACGSGSAATSTVTSTPHSGGTLTYALATAPDSLDPNYAPGAVDYRVMREIFDSLVAETKDGKFLPWLATSWTISPDGKTYTFSLRKDVKFQDGTAFNAQAVCFNFDRIVSPQEKSRYAISLIGPYRSCQATDDYTATVSFSAAYSPLLSALSGAFLGLVSPAAAQKYGADFGMHPVGTGPFSFVSYTLNDQIVVKKNPDYNWAPATAKHKGAAYLDEIDFKIVPESTTRLGSVTSGAILATESVAEQDAAKVKSSSDLYLDAMAVPGAPYQLFINQQHEPWNDVTARKALRAAMDMPDVIKSLYFGVYLQAWGPISPTTTAYDATVERNWMYDPTNAGKLFDSIGWTMGPDGLRHKGTKTLSIVYQEFSPNREKRQNVAQFLQQNLQKVGVKVDPQFLPAAPGLNSIQEGRYDIAGLSLVNGDPSVMYSEYHSRFQPSPGRFGFNLAHLNNPDMDQWLVDGQATTDPVKRNDIYSKAQNYVTDNAVSVGVYVQTYLVAASKKVHDIGYDQQAYPLFYDTYLG